EAAEDYAIDALLEGDGQHERLVPAERLPRQIRQRLHIVDRIHLDVLVGLVEFDAAGHTGKVLCRCHDIADRLRVLAAAAMEFGDARDLMEGVGIDVRWFLIVFGLEGANEVLPHVALVGRIELDDADVAERRLARLLLETEGQPDRAELDRLPAATLGDASLRQRLRDAQALALGRIGRYHITFPY